MLVVVSVEGFEDGRRLALSKVSPIAKNLAVSLLETLEFSLYLASRTGAREYVQYIVWRLRTLDAVQVPLEVDDFDAAWPEVSAFRMIELQGVANFAACRSPQFGAQKTQASPLSEWRLCAHDAEAEPVGGADRAVDREYVRAGKEFCTASRLEVPRWSEELCRRVWSVDRVWAGEGSRHVPFRSSCIDKPGLV